MTTVPGWTEPVHLPQTALGHLRVLPDLIISQLKAPMPEDVQEDTTGQTAIKPFIRTQKANIHVNMWNYFVKKMFLT